MRISDWSSDVCSSDLPALLQHAVVSDGELQPDELDFHHACLLRDGGPWGQGYPEPLFAGVFEVLRWRVVGDRHLKLELGVGGRRVADHPFGGWGGEPPPSRVRPAQQLEAYPSPIP